MAVAAEARPPRNRRVGERQEALAGFAMIGVPMVLFLVLQIGAILYAMFISVWRWNVRTGPVEFEGLDNYVGVFKDPIFISAITNTLYYTALWVPLTMAVGLFLAVVVNQKIRGRAFFRGAFYFPSIASSAAITTLWIFLVAPDGLFNEARAALSQAPFLGFLDFSPNRNWMGDYRTAMNTVIVLNVWTTSGTFMLFYLASLQSISNDVYEAAAIDGAGAWDTFWRVTFPLLRPGHFFVATVGVIGGLQLFDQVIHRRGTGWEPGELPHDGRPLPVQPRLQTGRLRRGRRRRRGPVRHHLQRDADPAADLRAQGDGDGMRNAPPPGPPPEERPAPAPEPALAVGLSGRRRRRRPATRARDGRPRGRGRRRRRRRSEQEDPADPGLRRDDRLRPAHVRALRLDGDHLAQDAAGRRSPHDHPAAGHVRGLGVRLQQPRPGCPADVLSTAS